MLRTIVVAALSFTLSANAVHAEESSAVGRVPSAPIRTSIAQVRFEVPDHTLPAAWQRAARPNRTAQKVTAGVAMGMLGLFGGAAIGAALDRNCHCDDPGLRGGLIGAPIGAVVGAVAGVLLASR
jgi:hypothetical protein